MLNFWYHVQSDQFAKAKQNINVPCIIFVHLGFRETTTEQLI